MNITKQIWCLTLIIALFASCKDDEQEQMRRDVFKPKIVAEIVKGNVVKIMWYKVLDGVSYTVQVADDEAFTNILDEKTTEELSYTSPRLPYSTKFYVRLRTNAKYEENNSIWKVLDVTTMARDVQPILKDVDATDILETSITIRWDVKEKCPADHITIETMSKGEDGTTPAPIEIELSEEKFLKGNFIVENLQPATNYKATIYNNQVEDIYERPYNSVTFKTAGAPDGAKVITSADDFNSILFADQNAVDIPEGQVYYLRGGGSWAIAGFSFKKGFHIMGAPGVVTELNVTSVFTPTDNAGKIIFTNIKLAGTNRLIYNEANDGKSYTWGGLEMKNCNITGFNNGFMMLQTSTGNFKCIQNISIDNCIFNEMQGGRFLETNNFTDVSAVLVQVDKVEIKNTTFMNSPKMLLLFLPDAYGNSGSKIQLVMTNVTVFEALGRAGSYRTIQMNRLTKESSVSITKCLFSNEMNASSDQYMFYETCLCGSAVTSYSDNYITGSRDETGKKNISAKKLNLTQEQLFVNSSEDNLKIKDESSVVYLDQIGDVRWLK